MKKENTCASCNKICKRTYCSRICYYTSRIGRNSALKGRKQSVEHVLSRIKSLQESYRLGKITHWNKGNKGRPCHTEEWKQKLRERLTEHNPSKNPLIKKKISERIKWMFKNDSEYKRKFQEANCRRSLPLDKNPNWRGGVTPMWAKERSTLSSQLATWSRLVRAKHYDKCKYCGSQKQLEVDHIKSFKKYPNLRLDVNNGQLLCRPCHKIKTREDCTLCA